MESIIGAVFKLFTIFVCLGMIFFSFEASKWKDTLGIILFFLVVLIITIFI